MKKLEEWETEEELTKELDDIEAKIQQEIDKENEKKLSPSLLTKIRKLNREMEMEGA